MKRKIIILLSLIFGMNIFAENNYLYDFNKEPLLFKFPITNISEVEFMNGELKRQMITIGSYNYYLVYGDPRRG